MPQTSPPIEHWTAEQVRGLPQDGKRYEVVEGVLFVTPAPRLVHQEAVRLLLRALGDYLDANAVGAVSMAPADIAFGPRTLVQPDLFVAPLVEGRRPREWSDIATLLLAVEVLSPSTARQDHGVKRKLYQRVGVREYWILDLDARLIERWRPGDERPDVLDTVLTWQPAESVAPLALDLPAFFGAVWGADDPGA